jgi:hypothetical protein
VKKIAILFFVILFGILNSFEFRGLQWGSSPDDVKALEDSTPIADESDKIVFKDNINGFDCNVYYSFINNHLYMGASYFTHSHSNKTDYINDYKSLKELLSHKYGEPITDDTIWYDDLFKNDPSDWGMAISIGHLAYSSKWRVDDTDIYLILKGDNYEINMFIRYSNDNLMEKAKEKETNETKDKL